ncbi:hypothetical protein RO3G_07468 [Rhizopus delemar RA 99-880]|uniref:Uncharacterized protein n=1 Tax=Rhizopus delemar (strain RA 99-880 / ATCC MYA-4621 / FGSC 9543 / NRRL 43880) TaxID=246409 RepID=I1C2T3_RHIO9|nr:hypothetical protein RO3G_07468 [Rhizopus delemar RA 99-880]|eukprot:EIE82763.1 hypothetical protein RO3G_07468 [Rhizopus delemar RA 99-880]
MAVSFCGCFSSSLGTLSSLSVSTEPWREAAAAAAAVVIGRPNVGGGGVGLVSGEKGDFFIGGGDVALKLACLL